MAVSALAQIRAGRYYSGGPCSELGGRQMWNVYEYRPNDEKVAAMLLVAVVSLVVAGTIGYCIGLRNAGADVSGNGGGNAGAGQQIEQAGTDIQNATDGIKEAAGTADQIGSTIKDAKDTAGYIHSTAADSAGIIAECQSILKGIRSRGKTNQAAH